MTFSTNALLALLLCGPLRAADTKSVADMTPQELEHYLGKGKQSAIGPVIIAARDPLNKSAASKAAELYSRLRSLTPFDGVEVPVLLESLADASVCADIQKVSKNEQCRVALVDALALIGPSAEAASGPLTALLSDELLRCRAAVALGKIKPTPSPVPALVTSLRAGNECAIDALGDLGASAKAAVPLLASMLKSPDFPHKDRVAAALVSIGTPGTLAAVDQYHKQEAQASKAVDAAVSERDANWLKSQPWSAKQVLTGAGKCKVAEDALGRAKAGPEHDAAFSSGEKICLAFNDDYAAYAKKYGDEAVPFLWRYCGEHYNPKLCAAMRGWIETHP